VRAGNVAYMARDPLAPVAGAVADLVAAHAAIEDARAAADELVRAARQRERDARAELHRRMVTAALQGVRQVDLVRTTGLTREAIRRILRAGGVESE
jgi:hypothetical protein